MMASSHDDDFHPQNKLTKSNQIHGVLHQGFEPYVLTDWLTIEMQLTTIY